MAAIVFPPGPHSPGDPFTDIDTGQTFIWNGDAWVRQNPSAGIGEAPLDGNQYARSLAAWVLSRPDIYYLGASATYPIEQQPGVPLITGNTFLHTGLDKMMFWDGTAWQPFGPVIQIFGLLNYTYPAATYTAGSPITGADVYGNTPNSWIQGQTIVIVFVDGVRQVEELNNATHPGDFTVNYSLSQITPVNADFVSANEVVIQTVEALAGDDASIFPFVLSSEDPPSNSDTKLVTELRAQGFVRNRNVLINGDFSVWQRGVTFSSDQYAADRMYNAGSTFNQIINDLSGGAKYAFNSGGSGTVRIIQGVEDIAQFVEGETWTISWRTNMEMSYNIGFSNRIATVTGTSVAAVPTLVGDYQAASFQIPAKPGDEILLRVAVVDSASGISAHVTDIQLEKGTIATPFERKPYSEVLTLCQHYYFSEDEGPSYFYVTTTGSNKNKVYLEKAHPVYMRTPPVITYSYGELISAPDANVSLHRTLLEGTLESAEDAAWILNFEADAEIY